MSTKNKIILMVSIMLAVILLLVFIPNSKTSKYEGLAKALENSGSKFYGAFWCTHCQAQKAEFGSAKKYLPYIECSTADAKEQLQVCIDEKIEGYPTWTFTNELVFKSSSEPIICLIKTEGVEVSEKCINSTSEFFNTYLFPDYPFSVRSFVDPIVEEGVWKFEPETQISGKIPLEFLAKQINFVLPE